MVLRHPLERFYSLYFDKVWGKSDNSFGWIGEALARNRRFRVERDLTAEEHHDNCCRLLGFLESRFNDEKPEDQNAHWRPQYVRAEQAADFGFHGVQLEKSAGSTPHSTSPNIATKAISRLARMQSPQLGSSTGSRRFTPRISPFMNASLLAGVRDHLPLGSDLAARYGA